MGKVVSFVFALLVLPFVALGQTPINNCGGSYGAGNYYLAGPLIVSYGSTCITTTATATIDGGCSAASDPATGITYTAGLTVTNVNFVQTKLACGTSCGALIVDTCKFSATTAIMITDNAAGGSGDTTIVNSLFTNNFQDITINNPAYHVINLTNNIFMGASKFSQYAFTAKNTGATSTSFIFVNNSISGYSYSSPTQDIAKGHATTLIIQDNTFQDIACATLINLNSQGPGTISGTFISNVSASSYMLYVTGDGTYGIPNVQNFTFTNNTFTDSSYAYGGIGASSIPGTISSNNFYSSNFTYAIYVPFGTGYRPVTVESNNFIGVNATTIIYSPSLDWFVIRNNTFQSAVVSTAVIYVSQSGTKNTTIFNNTFNSISTQTAPTISSYTIFITQAATNSFATIANNYLHYITTRFGITGTGNNVYITGNTMDYSNVQFGITNQAAPAGIISQNLITQTFIRASGFALYYTTTNGPNTASIDSNTVINCTGDMTATGISAQNFHITNNLVQNGNFTGMAAFGVFWFTPVNVIGNTLINLANGMTLTQYLGNITSNTIINIGNSETEQVATNAAISFTNNGAAGIYNNTISGYFGQIAISGTLSSSASLLFFSNNIFDSSFAIGVNISGVFFNYAAIFNNQIINCILLDPTYVMTAFAGFKVATVLNLDFENNVIYNLASKNTDPFCNNNDDLQTHRVGMLFLANTNTTMKNNTVSNFSATQCIIPAPGFVTNSASGNIIGLAIIDGGIAGTKIDSFTLDTLSLISQNPVFFFDTAPFYGINLGASALGFVALRTNASRISNIVVRNIVGPVQYDCPCQSSTSGCSCASSNNGTNVKSMFLTAAASGTQLSHIYFKD